MAKRYPVRLLPAERAVLGDLLAAGTTSARTQTHARILLKADQGEDGPGWPDARIAEAVEASEATVARVRRRWAEGGLDDALHRRPTGPRARKLDGAQEARLVAVACAAPPAGHARWTLRLLAARLVELEVVDGIAPNTVRAVLKKNVLKPWLKKEWCIAPKEDAAFVARMEDILDVYARPPDPRRPLVCFDEGRKELHGEVRDPLPMVPGHPLRFDTEYARHGTANLFLWCAPHLGQRGVTVTARRTRIDFAHAIRDLVDVQFPHAERIVLVLDNLNTHEATSLYLAFPPAEAKRLWDRLEIHPTPKHGSWLNVAEIELSVLGRRCLDRRIPDQATLAAEVAAWVAERTATAVTVDWQFTTEDARIKLAHLYPNLVPVT